MIFLMLIFKYYIIKNINIITNTNINKNNYTEIIETEKDINNNEVKIDKSKRNNLSSLNETEDWKASDA